MDTLHWDCSLCSSQNDTALTNCSVCDAARPLQNPQPRQANRNQRQAHSVKKPHQLFSILNDRIVLNHETLRLVHQNFHPTKPICTLNATGHLGTGKSTWLNMTLKNLGIEVDDLSEMFEIGHHQQTKTNGLWIYPYPLMSPDNVQFLLFDMEGTEGIVMGDPEAHEKAINKLFFLLFTLCSVFTLHTSKRVDSQTAKRLKEVFFIAQQLKQEVQIELPHIVIMVAECEVPQANDGRPFEDFLKESCGFAQELVENLRVIGRPKYPDGFLEALENGELEDAFELLEGSKSETANLKFLDDCNLKPKMKPGRREPMARDDFVEFTRKLTGIINCDQFTTLFKDTLDQKYIEVLQPIKQEILQKFDADAEALASSFPVEKELTDFQSELTVLRSKAKDSFLEEIQKKLSIDIKQNHRVQGETAHFITSLKNNTYDQSFLLRKSKHENQEYLQQMEELKTTFERNKVALQNLEKKSQQDQEQMKALFAEQARKDSQYQFQMLQQQRTTEQQLAQMQRSLDVERAQRASDRSWQEKVDQEHKKIKELEERLKRSEAQVGELNASAFSRLIGSFDQPNLLFAPPTTVPVRRSVPVKKSIPAKKGVPRARRN